MFFVQVMGRSTRISEANTLTALGKIVTKELSSMANDCIVVAVGKNSNAVMPYVWIRRNLQTDEWEGELGDCIKLGIKDGLINEKQPIEMLNLEQAIYRGVAEVYDDGVGQVISMRDEPIAKPKASKKRTNEENLIQATKMIKDLFASLKEEG